jgi:hypothetical protein
LADRFAVRCGPNLDLERDRRALFETYRARALLDGLDERGAVGAPGRRRIREANPVGLSRRRREKRVAEQECEAPRHDRKRCHGRRARAK